MSIEAVSAKSLGALGFLGGAGTVLAEAMPVPDGWSSWPATAICGFIALASLALLYFKLKLDCEVTKAATAAQVELTVAIRSGHELQEGTNRLLTEVSGALMKRPCMVEKGK